MGTKVNKGGASGDLIRQIVSKAENLLEEKKQTMEDLRDVWREGKSQGLNIKVIKQIIKKRAKNAAELAEQEEIQHLYEHALGMEDQED